MLRLERTADGWNLAQLIKARTPDPDSPTAAARSRSARSASATARCTSKADRSARPASTCPRRIDGLDASVGVKSNEDELTVDIAHVSLRTGRAALGAQALSGVVRQNQTTWWRSMTCRSEPTRARSASTAPSATSKAHRRSSTSKPRPTSWDSTRSPGSFPRFVATGCSPRSRLRATGPADRLSVDVNVRDEALGKLTGDADGRCDGAARRVAGTASLEHFNVGPLVPAKRRPAVRAGAPGVKSDITGEARIDLALPSERLPLSGTYAVNAGTCSSRRLRGSQRGRRTAASTDRRSA